MGFSLLLCFFGKGLVFFLLLFHNVVDPLGLLGRDGRSFWFFLFPGPFYLFHLYLLGFRLHTIRRHLIFLLLLRLFLLLHFFPSSFFLPSVCLFLFFFSLFFHRRATIVTSFFAIRFVMLGLMFL